METGATMEVSAEKLLELMKGRRSVRKYLSDPIPGKDIETMITAASWAPSGANVQNWHFIAVRGAETKDAMVAAVRQKIKEYSTKIGSPRAQKEFLAYGNYFLFFNTAPVVMAVVRKPYRSLNVRIMERYSLDGATASPTSSSGIQGPAAAVQNLMLMAYALGYGACWMTGPLIAKEDLERILAIQSPDELMTLVTLGKPAHAPAAPARKKPEEILTYR